MLILAMPASGRFNWSRRIVWLEPFWVLLLGAFLLVPGRFLPGGLEGLLVQARPWLVAALLVGWPLRRLAYASFSRRTPLDWPLWLLVLWLPVTIWASADKAMSWEVLGHLAFGLALYLALVNWPPLRQHPEWLGWLLLLLGVGLTLVSPLLSELTASKVFRVGTLDPILKYLSNLVPGNVNANRIGGILVVLWPLAAALALRRGWTARAWLPWLCALVTAMALLVLALTQARGAYLATAVAFALLLLLRWPRLVYALPVVIAAGALFFYQFGDLLFEQQASASAVNSLEGRMEIWSRALYALADFSFTGIGLGTFDLVIPLLYPFFIISPGTELWHAHNLFLQIGLDLGIPGLIAYLALHINVFVLLFRVLRRRDDVLSWCLAAGVAGGLVAMFVHGLTDAPLWGSKPAFLPWLLVTLAVLLGLHATHAEETARNVETP